MGYIMFGNEVVNILNEKYDDAYISAHLEVPGEMFDIAMEKSLYGNGVVGSTADILKFISAKVLEAANESKHVTSLESRRLRFILGTEAGMVAEDSELGVVPGVAGGDGCSTAGGCATCPFMKMNDLDALNDIMEMVIDGRDEFKLKSHLPPNRLHGKMINGVSAIDLGSEPILYMRYFMKEKQIPDQLVQKVISSSYS